MFCTTRNAESQKTLSCEQQVLPGNITDVFILKESKPKKALEGTVAGEQNQPGLDCSETFDTLMEFLSDKLT